MRSGLLTILVCLVWFCPAGAFDQQHSRWTQLLQKHVVWISSGHASAVDYAAFQQDRDELKSYLADLSAVPAEEFSRWPAEERLAFLINAYNAFTVELILTAYPELESIKDLGSFFSSPWKKEFFTLLGKQRNLDDIEHGMIRVPGAYDEPRIHFAVNCASVGCPALRNEAYVANRLTQQLEDNAVRFFSDRNRNRYNRDKERLEVSELLDWYEDDFQQGYLGIHSLAELLARYADYLADREEDRQNISSASVPIRFLDYDWQLNDVSRTR